VTYSAETIALEEVTVKANRFERKDTETTYASEIHTSKQITQSGASTLFDYLAQQSSLNLGSNFGNKATPSINLRGYGQNGFQNVVITVDGQKLNNVDLSPQLLVGIPLGNIERIEITKGSGSVVYGDGATAGAIQIYTKAKTGVTTSTSWGNFGQKNHYVNAGISEKHIDLSANLSHDSHDGFSKKDVSGHKDQYTSNTQNVKLRIKPTERLSFLTEATSSRNDIRYSPSLTEAFFKADPRLNGGKNYTQQSLNTDQWKLGAEYYFTDNLSMSANHFREDKLSEFSSGFFSDYDYESNDIALKFINDVVSIAAGYQSFDGERNAASNTTTKDNKAIWVNGDYKPLWLSDALTVSTGVRKEKVSYTFNPDNGADLKQSENLSAWDIGANYQFSNTLSAFTNYNFAFQTPDIDRFFAQDFSLWPIVTTSFNGFIQPQRARTVNVGLNHVVSNNRLKLTLFRADLDNEIFYEGGVLGGKNSNLDKTHKYGLEVQDTFAFNDQLTASATYNYIKAIVDSTTTSNGTLIKNKTLPGVPEHNFTGNLNYRFLNGVNVNVNHVWRSKAYAFNDFQNNFNQKQDNYETTNLAVNYAYKNYTVFATINNLFEKENSIQVRDDAIYPVDFVRTWRIGMKADF
jgi:iron complex outermembrane receptor protein